VNLPRGMRDPLGRALLATAAVIAVAWLSMFNSADPDLWGHVRYGQDVLAAGHLPRTATHTYTAPDHPWINHEILAEMALAVTADAGGRAALIALKGALAFGVVAILAATALTRGAGAAVTAVSLVAVAVNVAPGWSWRPQLFGYCLYLLEMLILATGRGRWLLPPLVAVWTNTHGSFLAGLGVLGAYLGGEAAEAWWRGDAAARRTALRNAAVIAASTAATLVNPYGVHLLVWLARDLAPPRPEIVEWRPLTFGDIEFVPFLSIALPVALAWLLNRGARTWAWSLVLALTVWQSVRHVRHITFFALAAGVWLPPALETIVRRYRTGAPSTARSVRLAWLYGTVWPVALLVAGGVLVTRRGLQVDRAQFPVNAFTFMAEHRLTGRLLPNFDWAQYAIATFAPATAVAFDGRLRTCYPQSLADFYFDFLIGDSPRYRWRDPSSPPFDDERILHIGDPDFVLVNRRFPHAVEVMGRQRAWVVLYQDGLAQLWGRRSRYDDPTSPLYLAPELRRVSDEPQTGLVAWPAFPPGTPMVQR
jgi:hypothetical protein